MNHRLGAASVLLMVPALAIGQTVYELLPSTPQANGLFGSAVAIDGEVAVVGMQAAGAPGPTVASGAVFVFRFDGSDWVEEQRIPSPVARGAFGAAVAVSGDAMVIGAPGPTSSTAGRAFFYRYINGQWIEQDSFVKSAGQAIVKYATAVDIDGDLAVVSDWVVNDGKNYGAAYIYEYDGSSWAETHDLSPADGISGGNFGFSIDLEGETLLVGMPEDRADASTTRVGSAYVYRKTGSEWALVQKLVAPIRNANDQFGRSVALSGDVAMIHSGLTAQAHTFDGRAWTYSETIQDPAVDPFGYPIGMSGPTAAVHDGTMVDLYIFDGTSWVDAGSVSATDGTPVGTFGAALALDGSRLIVGSSAHTHDGLRSGSAYIFEPVNSVASVPGAGGAPPGLDIQRVYPNPFRQRTTILYSISQSGPVTIDIYDLIGRHVTRLRDVDANAGHHEAEWLSELVSEGAYVVQIRSAGQRASRLLVKTK